MTQSIRNQQKTTRVSKKGIQRKWYLVDASKAPIGRIATIVSNLLRGKNTAAFAQDADVGGMVVVINSDKAVLTGMKPNKKVYFSYSGRLGGLRHRTFKQQMALDSRKVIYHAVSGMVSKNRHRDIWMNNRLFIIKDDNHNKPHKLISAN